MNNSLSPENLGALFRLHDVEIDQTKHPVVFEMLKTIVAPEVSDETAFFHVAEISTPLEAFSILRQYLLKKHGEHLNEEDVFYITEVLGFCEHMVAPVEAGGMAIPSDIIFAYLRKVLGTESPEDPVQQD